MKSLFFLVILLITQSNLSSQILVKDWENKFNGINPVKGDEDLSKTLVDNSNNIITGGTNRIGNTESEISISKYDESGILLWNTTYSKNTFNYFIDLLIEPNGNSYVLGGLDNQYNGYSDLILIKLNPAGDTIWTRRSAFLSLALKIERDSEGNILVLGRTVIYPLGNNKYALLKYNTNGTLLWSRSFTLENPNSFDRPSDMKIDISGYIYITGTSHVLDDKYMTLKIDPLGYLYWSKYYDSPFGDNAQFLELDNSFNIYVTGISNNGTPDHYDITTIKYGPLANEIWVRRFEAPDLLNGNTCSLQLDSKGNVYVGGYCKRVSSLNDFTVLKYNSDGLLKWSGFYNSEYNGEDLSYAMAVNSAGEIYMAGQKQITGNQYRCLTIKMDSTGQLIWENIINGSGSGKDRNKSLTLDPDQNVIVAGEIYSASNNKDFVIEKYDQSGSKLWGHTGNKDFNYSADILNVMTIDAEQNIFVGGLTQRNGSYKVVMIKYNPAGQKLWESYYEMTRTYESGNSFIRTDSEGSVYYALNIYHEVTGLDPFIFKFSADGDFIWSQNFNCFNNSQLDQMNDIDIDKENNIYIAGGAYISSIINNSFLLKADKNGNQLWNNIYTSSTNNFINGICTDDSSNVYAAGNIGNSLLLFKYDNSGNTILERFENGGSGTRTYSYDIAIDSLHNIYTTGRFYTWNQNPPPITQSNSYSTLKFNANGELMWWKKTNTQYYSTSAYSISLDNNRNVIVTGNIAENENGYGKVVTDKYDTNGNTLWTRQLNTPGNLSGRSSSLSVDSLNNIYVLATCESLDNKKDLFAIKYVPLGSPLWLLSYNGTANRDDFGKNLLLDNDFNIYLCGNSTEKFSSTDFVLLKYRQNVLNISEQNQNIPGKPALIQNYPNPFNPVTKIRFNLPNAGHVKITVYDIRGNQVSVIVNEEKTSGEYEVLFDASELASGVYFSRMKYLDLSSGSIFSQVKQMILLK